MSRNDIGEASERNAGEPAEVGPTEAELDAFCGWWHPIKVDGREEMLKAMKLPWILRKIAATMSLPDTFFFRHEDGFLHSHTVMFGKVVDECYKEGGSSSKSKFGVTTTLRCENFRVERARAPRPITCAHLRRYHWEGNRITYTLEKSGSPEEETKSGRWVLPDGDTMVSET